MPSATAATRHICTRCLRVTSRLNGGPYNPSQKRWFADPPGSPPAQDATSSNVAAGAKANADEEEGAMSRRLAQMSEESLETGGRSARKAVEEAAFDEGLRRELEEKIASANFRNEHASALAQAGLPASAGRGTRDIAGARPWTGTESVEDAALRMLTDAHKPMRTPVKILSPRGPPPRVDTGRSRSKPSSGARLANARDRSSIYSTLKDSNMTEAEKEQYRKEMKERFAPAARSVPATLQGLASLANERIEDAIARGQFKNLPRGKKIERDYNMSSPFLDTTEYFMNKIIQKQDIVPPWIEKQQELVSTATKFRGRLRNDWRRHASRLIASKGGTLQEQIRRAEAYAAAEAIANPPKRKEEKINTVNEGGHMSQITLAGELNTTTAQSSSAPEVSHITVTETPVASDGSPTSSAPQASAEVTITQPTESAAPNSAPVNTTTAPFRDPMWEANEHSYLALTIDHLNALTRSYNLMAPNPAKKPYYNLERELRSCYADVAPQLADAIRERAMAPKARVEVIGHKPGGVMERFGGGKAKVYDERKEKAYGFKEFWRDLFAKRDA